MALASGPDFVLLTLGNNIPPYLPPEQDRAKVASAHLPIANTTALCQKQKKKKSCESLHRVPVLFDSSTLHLTTISMTDRRLNEHEELPEIMHFIISRSTSASHRMPLSAVSQCLAAAKLTRWPLDVSSMNPRVHRRRMCLSNFRGRQIGMLLHVLMYKLVM